MKYTIKVASSGTYSLAVRGAAAGAGGKFHVEIDGVDQTGPLSIPNTYFSQFFTTVTKTGVFLSAGIHVMRLSMDSGGADGTAGSFNWLQFTQTATAAAHRAREGGRSIGGRIIGARRAVGSREARPRKVSRRKASRCDSGRRGAHRDAARRRGANRDESNRRGANPGGGQRGPQGGGRDCR